MKGYVKVEAMTKDGREGYGCEVHVEDVSVVDKIAMVHAMTYALEFDDLEIELLCAAMKSGLLSKLADVESVQEKEKTQSDPQSALVEAFLKLLK